jgi:N-methylhydantoinase B/oxoprolinase/acetone carboxylase alpha subunit
MIGNAVSAITTDTAVSVVAATTSLVEFGSHRATRSAMTIYNEPGSGNGTLYLKFGAGATTANYSNRLGPGDYWESSPPKYTGPVTGLWDVAQGRALVSEFLP